MKNEDKIDKRLLDDLKNLPKVDAPKNFQTELLRKLNSSEEIKEESFWSKLLSPIRLAPAAVAIGTAIIIFFVVDINSERIEDPLNIAPRLREDLVVIETIKEIPIETQKKSSRQKENSDRILDSKVLIKEKDDARALKKSDAEGLIREDKSNSIEQFAVDELESEANFADSFRSEETRMVGGSKPPPAGTLESEINEASSSERKMKRGRDRIANLPVVQGSSDNDSKDNINFMQRNLSTEDKMEVQQLKMKIQSEKSAKTQEKSTKAP